MKKILKLSKFSYIKCFALISSVNLVLLILKNESEGKVTRIYIVLYDFTLGREINIDVGIRILFIRLLITHPICFISVN